MSAIRSNVSSHVSYIFDAMPPDTKSLLAATWPCCICSVHEHASVSSFEHSRMPPSVRRPTQSRGNSAKTKVFPNPSEVTGYPAPGSPIGVSAVRNRSFLSTRSWTKCLRMRVSFRIRHPAYFRLRVSPVLGGSLSAEGFPFCAPLFREFDTLDATPAFAALG